MTTTETPTETPTVVATGSPEALDGPEALEVRFAELVAAGDLDGLVGLYAVDAVVSLPHGREAAGHAAIRAALAAALAAGALGPAGRAVTTRAIVTGDLALTTSTTADGEVRTQVARRTAEGRWAWVCDGWRLRGVQACLPASTGLPAGSGSRAVA